MKDIYNDILSNGYEEVFTSPGQSADEIILYGRLLQDANGVLIGGRFGGRDYWDPCMSDGRPTYKDGMKVDTIRVYENGYRFFRRQPLEEA